MATNRYARMTPARYQASSMDELMMLPAMKRKQHDLAMTQANQMGMFDIQAADEAGRQRLKSLSDEYGQAVDSFVQDINTKGINNSDTQRLMQLYNKRNELKQNYFDPAKQQVAKIQQYQEDMKDKNIIGDWDRNMAQQFANQYISNYRTFDEEGNVNTFQGQYMPKYVDASKFMDTAIKNVEGDQVQGLMQKYNIKNADTFTDFLTSEKVDYLDKNKILKAVQTQMMSDIPFQRSYATEYALSGGKGDPFEFGEFNKDGTYDVNQKSPLDVMLYGKAIGKAYQKRSRQFSSNQRDLDLYKTKKELDAAKESPEVPYSRTPFERKEIYSKSFISKLKNIGSQLFGAKATPSSSSSLGGGLNFSMEETGKATIEDVLDQDELVKYNTIVSKMRDMEEYSNKLGPNAYDNKTVQTVIDYMTEYENANVSSVKFKPNQIFNGDMIEGAPLNTTDAKKAQEAIVNDLIAGDRKLYDKNGNELEIDGTEFGAGWFDGVDNVDLTNSDNNIFYDGFYSPYNAMDKMGSKENDATMPHVLNINGEEFYVSRTASEMETDWYRAGRKIKETIDGGLENPTLPNYLDTQDPVLQSKNINELVTAYDPIKQEFSLTVTRNGNPESFTGLSYEQFYNGMKNLYNTK